MNKKSLQDVKLRDLQPWARLWVIAIGAVMLFVFVHGIIFYRDAPIKPCRTVTGYCGKGNTVRTADEYEAFKRWETTLVLIWPTGIIALIALSTRQRPR